MTMKGQSKVVMSFSDKLQFIFFLEIQNKTHFISFQTKKKKELCTTPLVRKENVSKLWAAKHICLYLRCDMCKHAEWFSRPQGWQWSLTGVSTQVALPQPQMWLKCNHPLPARAGWGPECVCVCGCVYRIQLTGCPNDAQLCSTTNCCRHKTYLSFPVYNILK